MRVVSSFGANRLRSAEPAGSRGAPEPAARGIPTLYRRHVARRLTAEQNFAFKELSPAALWLAGNLDGPQPRALGDNRGGWPVEMGLTQRWAGLSEDNQFVDRDAYNKRGVFYRLWCDHYDLADRLQCAVFQALRVSGRVEPAIGEWMSLDADMTLDDLSAVVLGEASRLRIETWTDDDMIRRFDDLIAMARKVG